MSWRNDFADLIKTLNLTADKMDQLVAENTVLKKENAELREAWNNSIDELTRREPDPNQPGVG